jgi:hypothetical protein
MMRLRVWAPRAARASVVDTGSPIVDGPIYLR